jgi:hypothetical protein
MRCRIGVGFHAVAGAGATASSFRLADADRSARKPPRGIAAIHGVRTTAAGTPRFGARVISSQNGVAR